MLPIRKRIRWSRQNGLIFVNAKGEVLVGGCKQTSARYALLWAQAFERPDFPQGQVASILMLGLAGGGALPAIRAAYPEAKITAVEHDPRMIELARELGEVGDAEVIAGDAKRVLLELERSFDLILVDIFHSFTPSSLLKEESFWDAIKSRLRQDGCALVNVAGSRAYLDLPERMFAHAKVWRYDTNIFGGFWD